MICYVGKHGHIRLESYFVTGGWRSSVAHLERSMASFARRGRGIKGFYVGIASGTNQFDGMRKRIDEDKASMAIKRMVCVYESSSRSFVQKLEKELITRFSCYDLRTMNEGLGGEGRLPSPELMNYLYFAFSYESEKIWV